MRDPPFRSDYAVLLVEDDWEVPVYHGANAVRQAQAAGELQLAHSKRDPIIQVELYQWRDGDHRVTRRWRHTGNDWEETSTPFPELFEENEDG